MSTTKHQSRETCNFDFDLDMNVSTRLAGLTISETTIVLGFLLTTVSTVCTKWWEKQKTPSERVLWKCFVGQWDQRKIAKLVWASRKSVVTQIITLNSCRQHAQYFKPGGGCATTAEDPTGFHYCQPRAGIWSYHCHMTGRLDNYMNV